MFHCSSELRSHVEHDGSGSAPVLPELCSRVGAVRAALAHVPFLHSRSAMRAGWVALLVKKNNTLCVVYFWCFVFQCMWFPGLSGERQHKPLRKWSTICIIKLVSPL